jgi:hypothetical protein
MAPYNYNIMKDELSLSAWLAVGAAAQIIASLVLPGKYIFVPVALTAAILGLNWATQYLGLARNAYVTNAVMGRHSVMFPDEDGARPKEMGTKPVAMFLIGIRSNQFVNLTCLPSLRTRQQSFDSADKDVVGEKKKAPSEDSSPRTRS